MKLFREMKLYNKQPKSLGDFRYLHTYTIKLGISILKTHKMLFAIEEKFFRT